MHDRYAPEVDDLYHLKDDPRERHNLIDRYPEEAMRLSSQFGSYFRRMGGQTVKGLQGRYEVASGSVGER